MEQMPDARGAACGHYACRRMARYGVLADIHGNREALEAVLEALGARGIERFLCAGDVVGYNADPEACISLLYGRRCVSVAGNHDLAAVGAADLSGFSDRAAYALRRTRKALRPASLAWLKALPQARSIDGGISLRHDAPDPHARLSILSERHEASFREAEPGRWILSPGAVDASRRASGRLAECAILDTDAWTVEFLRLRYDAASTEIKAGMGGYRIGPLTARVYVLHRRIAYFVAATRSPRSARSGPVSAASLRNP